MWVYLYQSWTEKELKNAYIGEYRVPWANTVAYYPLTSQTTVNDLSGNNRNLTNGWSVVFGTYAGVSCAYFDTTDAKKLYWTLPLSWNTVFTINVWVYRLSNASWINPNIFTLWDTWIAWRCFWVGYTNNNNYYLFYTWGTDRTSTTLCTKDAWDMLTITNDGTKITMYKNNTQFLQYSVTLNVNTTNFTIWSFPYLTDNKWYIYNWYMSEFIIENKERTAQEISDYYNLTKWNYGL